MAADSNVGYECFNTQNIQQPENAGYPSGDMAVNILEGWGGCEAAEEKSPALLCFGAPWMRAECCHIGAFLPYWASDQEEWKWKMSYLCPNLNGTEKDTVPLRTELGESSGPGLYMNPTHWACSGMHSWCSATAR